MKDIDELIQNSEKYQHVLVQKRFQSKKNTVSYVLIDHQPRVLKWYAPGFRNNMETEYLVLQQGSSQLPMPSPLEKDTENNVIIMGYIPGNNLCDIINDLQIHLSEKQAIIRLLSSWFVRFHEFYKTEKGFRIRGDPNVRNFLYKDVIWGLDFEESRLGKPEEDVARMIASILTIDPMFTSEKFLLCRSFLDTYIKTVNWRLNNINEEIAYAVIEKIPWRPEQEEILRNYAKHIRKKGL